MKNPKDNATARWDTRRICDFLEQIFAFIVRDFSEFALKRYSKTDTSDIQTEYCKKIIKKPITDKERVSRIWKSHVISLKDAYEVNF